MMRITYRRKKLEKQEVKKAKANLEEGGDGVVYLLADQCVCDHTYELQCASSKICERSVICLSGYKKIKS